MVKRAKPTHEGAGGVPLDDDGIDAVSTEQLPEAGAECRREVPEALPRAHDPEV